jgi:DNA-binding LytR/AlgR family response regulator
MTGDRPGADLDVLVVDDERPAREDLAYLLRQHPRVAMVTTAGDATEALRRLRDGSFDALFLDIRMPGLDGLELARVLSRFAHPPDIVFVSAYENHAGEACELAAGA